MFSFWIRRDQHSSVIWSTKLHKRVRSISANSPSGHMLPPVNVNNNNYYYRSAVYLCCTYAYIERLPAELRSCLYACIRKYFNFTNSKNYRVMFDGWQVDVRFRELTVGRPHACPLGVFERIFILTQAYRCIQT